MSGYIKETYLIEAKKEIAELKECLSNSNEMLSELEKLWRVKMPNSAVDVRDQYCLAQNLINQ